jgi:alpha-glucosidase
MTTHTPTRVEDVRDPIGITGWPKEKGRDGERTPMQWTPGPQAGFSTNPHTWLPVGDDDKTINVATESSDPNSLLTWYRTLIALRLNNPALHDGGTIMLDPTNPNVLSYLRTAPTGAHPVLISINMTAQPQHVHFNLKEAHLTTTHTTTLLTDDPTLTNTTSGNDFTLPAFTSLITELQP